jgi:hypothetical protein
MRHILVEYPKFAGELMVAGELGRIRATLAIIPANERPASIERTAGDAALRIEQLTIVGTECR